MKLKIYILLTAILAVMASITQSCSDNSPSQETPALSDNPMMSVTLSVAGAPQQAKSGSDGGYEAGQGFENHIDIKNCHFFFFSDDEEPTYLATFEPFIRPTESTTQTSNGVETIYLYQFFGAVPQGLPMKFRLVVLANWQEYPFEQETATDGDFNLVKGVTKLSDILSHPSARFDAIEIADGEEWLGNDRLIPFYGVREYNLTDYVSADNIKDGKIKGDTKVDLAKKLDGTDTSVPLIRAMAKVEVILAVPFTSFDEVSIDRVNEKGYCAPLALKHTDYDHDYTWSEDFIEVHIPTDVDIKKQPLPLKKTSDLNSDQNTVGKWIAYIPEYKNLGMTNRCKINVTIADKTLPIYFSNDGTENSPTQYDVERNNIYRFTITEMTTTLSVEVDVQPYTEYVLQPDFGLNRNNLGDLIVEIDQNSQGKIEYSEAFNNYLAAYEKEVKKKLLPLYEQDGTDELIPDLNDVNQKDYYAIHVGGDGDIYSQETELWLMDSDGCRVLSNYANATDNAGNESTECSSRLVMYFPFASPENGIYYRKDDDHDIRLQHHDNHSCIVMRPDGNKYFKEYFDEKGVAYDKPQYTPVESWEGHWNPDPDQLNTTPGIFFIKVNVVMNGSTMTVYQKCSDQGIRQNYYVNDKGEEVNIKIESTL